MAIASISYNLKYDQRTDRDITVIQTEYNKIKSRVSKCASEGVTITASNISQYYDTAIQRYSYPTSPKKDRIYRNENIIYNNYYLENYIIATNRILEDDDSNYWAIIKCKNCGLLVHQKRLVTHSEPYQAGGGWVYPTYTEFYDTRHSKFRLTTSAPRNILGLEENRSQVTIGLSYTREKVDADGRETTSFINDYYANYEFSNLCVHTDTYWLELELKVAEKRDQAISEFRKLYNVDSSTNLVELEATLRPLIAIIQATSSAAHSGHKECLDLYNGLRSTMSASDKIKVDIDTIRNYGDDVTNTLIPNATKKYSDIYATGLVKYNDFISYINTNLKS